MERKRASGEFDTKDGNETLQVVQTDSGEILLVTCEAGQEREAAGLAYDDEVGDFSVVLMIAMMIVMVVMMIVADLCDHVTKMALIIILFTVMLMNNQEEQSHLPGGKSEGCKNCSDQRDATEAVPGLLQHSSSTQVKTLFVMFLLVP